MRPLNKLLDYEGIRVSLPRETQMLGRIGSELAALYHETLHAPLPEDLQELVEQLGPEDATDKLERREP